jgi:hypothetical protein
VGCVFFNTFAQLSGALRPEHFREERRSDLRRATVLKDRDHRAPQPQLGDREAHEAFALSLGREPSRSIGLQKFLERAGLTPLCETGVEPLGHRVRACDGDVMLCQRDPALRRRFLERRDHCRDVDGIARDLAALALTARAEAAGSQ